MTDDLNRSWTPLSHGPIERLTENLWRVTGSLPKMSLARVMTIVRRDDGTLLLHSVIALREAAMQELDALGDVREIIVPNAGHRLDAPAYKARYPEARVYCPRGGLARISEAVNVTGTYEAFEPDQTVAIETLDGMDGSEGVLVVRSLDGVSLIFNDTVMNMDPKRDLKGFLFTTLMGSAPGPRVSRAAKLFYVKDQPALRAHLERLAAIPDLVRVIVSHEKVANAKAAPAMLHQAASFLKA